MCWLLSLSFLLFVFFVLFCISGIAASYVFCLQFHVYDYYSFKCNVWLSGFSVGLVRWTCIILASPYYGRIFFLFQLWQIVLLGIVVWINIYGLVELWIICSRVLMFLLRSQMLLWYVFLFMWVVVCLFYLWTLFVLYG